MKTTLKPVDEFAELEQVIADGLRTFVEVGQALARIRDGGFYKKDHKTFEAYCQERWGIAKRTAYQFISAAEVAENVRHGALPVPTSERQARELAKLPAEQQADAWAKANETAPATGVTAKHVAAVVAETLGKPKSVAPSATRATPQPAPAPLEYAPFTGVPVHRETDEDAVDGEQDHSPEPALAPPTPAATEFNWLDERSRILRICRELIDRCPDHHREDLSYVFQALSQEVL